MKILCLICSFLVLLGGLRNVMGAPFLSVEEYVEFLNKKTASDCYYFYDSKMSEEAGGGIMRSGTPGAYFYQAFKDNNDSIIYVDTFSALCYANWKSASLTARGSEDRFSEDYLIADQIVTPITEHRDMLLKVNQPSCNFLEGSVAQESSEVVSELDLGEELLESIIALGGVTIGEAVTKGKEEPETLPQETSQAIERRSVTEQKLQAAPAKASFQLTNMALDFFLKNSLQQAEESVIKLRRMVSGKCSSNHWKEALAEAIRLVDFMRGCQQCGGIHARMLATIDRIEEALRLRIVVAMQEPQHKMKFLVKAIECLNQSLKREDPKEREYASALIYAAKNYEMAATYGVQGNQVHDTKEEVEATNREACVAEETAERLANSRGVFIGANEKIRFYLKRASKCAIEAKEASVIENHELANVLFHAAQSYEMTAQATGCFKQALAAGKIKEATQFDQEETSTLNVAQRFYEVASKLTLADQKITCYAKKASEHAAQAEEVNTIGSDHEKERLTSAAQYYQKAIEKLKEFKRALVADDVQKANRLFVTASSFEKQAASFLTPALTIQPPFFGISKTQKVQSAAKKKTLKIQPAVQEPRKNLLVRLQNQLALYQQQAIRVGIPGSKMWKQAFVHIEAAIRYTQQASATPVQDPKKAQHLTESAHKAITAAEYFAQAAENKKKATDANAVGNQQESQRYSEAAENALRMARQAANFLMPARTMQPQLPAVSKNQVVRRSAKKKA